MKIDLIRSHKIGVRAALPVLATTIFCICACSTNKQPSVPNNCTSAQVKAYNSVILSFDNQLEKLCSDFKSNMGDRSCVAENISSGKTMRISTNSVDQKCSKDKIDLFNMVSKGSQSRVQENSSDMPIANSVFQDGQTGITAEFTCMSRDEKGTLSKETLSFWVDKSGSKKDGQAWQNLTIKGDLFKDLSGEIVPGDIQKSKTTSVLIYSTTGYVEVAVLKVDGKTVTGVKSLMGISKKNTRLVSCE